MFDGSLTPVCRPFALSFVCHFVLIPNHCIRHFRLKLLNSTSRFPTDARPTPPACRLLVLCTCVILSHERASFIIRPAGSTTLPLTLRCHTISTPLPTRGICSRCGSFRQLARLRSPMSNWRCCRGAVPIKTWPPLMPPTMAMLGVAAVEQVQLQATATAMVLTVVVVVVVVVVAVVAVALAAVVVVAGGRVARVEQASHISATGEQPFGQSSAAGRSITDCTARQICGQSPTLPQRVRRENGSAGCGQRPRLQAPLKTAC
jgi:hypothetical protein